MNKIIPQPLIQPTLLNELSNPNITKRRDQQITTEISSAVQTIWTFICKQSGRKIGWWAFSNDVDYGDGNGSSGGHFDIETDHTFIDIGGEVTSGPLKEFNPYEEGFPTALLTDPFWQDTIINELDKAKQQQQLTIAQRKAAQAQKKQTMAQLKASIKAKLTKEELKIIKFKA